MVTNIVCYLRTHRRKRGLTQQELARLLLGRSGTNVSRVERGLQRPSTETAIAASVLFGIPTEEMFPALYKNIEERVIQQVYILHEKVNAEQSPRAKQVEALLRESLSRAVRNKELSHARV